MTKSKQPKRATAKKASAQSGELSDAALNQVTGAMLACMPTDQTVAHGSGGGGGAGIVLGDPPGENTLRPLKSN